MQSFNIFLYEINYPFLINTNDGLLEAEKGGGAAGRSMDECADKYFLLEGRRWWGHYEQEQGKFGIYQY